MSGSQTSPARADTLASWRGARRRGPSVCAGGREEAAAGAWGVVVLGELRGCAGCEPGARATDVVWARFGALSALLSEMPSASP